VIRGRILTSLMFSNSKFLLALATWLMICCATNTFLAQSQVAPQKRPRGERNSGAARGAQTFSSTCASCHGLDGRGGERAPNIAETPRVQRLSDVQIIHIIENGIPSGGMPAFHLFDGSQIKAIVAYLRTLQGTKKTVPPPGDAKRGEAVFTGKANCSTCHMVAGKGGFIASDLSSYARTHTAEEIRSAIANPPGDDRQVRMVTVIARSGEKCTGRVRNEDNFSLQLQSLDGVFHFFSKSEIEKLELDPQTLMPSDYRSTLTPDELKDVVSYLMSVAAASESNAPKKENNWDDD
jgi:cytochrome c oxidase cbb3-type subunit 3